MPPERPGISIFFVFLFCFFVFLIQVEIHKLGISLLYRQMKKLKRYEMRGVRVDDLTTEK